MKEQNDDGNYEEQNEIEMMKMFDFDLKLQHFNIETIETLPGIPQKQSIKIHHTFISLKTWASDMDA
jgi:hypothetical protein